MSKNFRRLASIVKSQMPSLIRVSLLRTMLIWLKLLTLFSVVETKSRFSQVKTKKTELDLALRTDRSVIMKDRAPNVAEYLKTRSTLKTLQI